MSNTQQISIATLVLAGVFATGCSQQQVQVQPTPEPTPPPALVVKPAPVIKPAPVVVTPPPAPVVKPAPVNPNCHSHPANAMTKSISHCHKNPQGQHHYGEREAPVVEAKPQINVRDLQRKLKSKGYYKGPIDGVVGTETRDALKRFQNR